MIDYRYPEPLKPMRAKYIGSGRLELLGKQMIYRKKVRFIGRDHKEATIILSPGDVVFVRYTSHSAGSNRVGEPRVQWVKK